MVSPLRMARLFAWSLADVDLFCELSTACLSVNILMHFSHFAVHWCLCICNKPADTLIKYINSLYYNAYIGKGGKSVTHIKYNLLDLFKKSILINHRMSKHVGYLQSWKDVMWTLDTNLCLKHGHGNMYVNVCALIRNHNRDQLQYNTCSA